MIIKDLVGGTIRSLWDEDDGEHVLIIDTPEYGMQAITVTKLVIEQGDDDDEYI